MLTQHLMLTVASAHAFRMPITRFVAAFVSPAANTEPQLLSGRSPPLHSPAEIDRAKMLEGLYVSGRARFL